MNDTDKGQGVQFERAVSQVRPDVKEPLLLTKEMRVNEDGTRYVEASDE